MNFRKVNFRSPAVLMVLGGVATLTLFVVVVTVLAITGDAKAVSDNAAVIGALVALGGVLTAQMVSIALDDRRSQEARELEAQRAHETALQKYFENVGKLLIEQPLREASPGDNLSTVVRAQTLSVLEGLDRYRKRILLQFLYESALINSHQLVVSLEFANLRKADLRDSKLRETNLKRVHLEEADLREADLSGADLSPAFLMKADLRKASLSGADLRKALLGEANLSEAYLNNANLSDTILMETNLSGAHLRKAHLRNAKLIKVNFSGADLRGADLSKALLREVNLNGANLTGITGLNNEELERKASAIIPITLEGAIMPDGSKHL